MVVSLDKKFIALLLVVSLLALMITARAGGFGEYAGFLVYNQSINTSKTEYWTLVNQYNYSVAFRVIPPILNISSTNVTPNVTFSALNGTINPNSYYQINVTVFIPYGAPSNTFWSGYATAFASSANGNSSEKIQLGTAKLIEINSEPYIPPKAKKTTSTTTIIQTSNTLSQNGNISLNDSTLIIIVLVIALVGTFAYILGSRPRRTPTKTRKGGAKS